MSESRICVVLVIDDLGFGGAERQVVELANNLDGDRFDVHVCVLSDHAPLADTLVESERRLHVVRRRSRFDFTVVPRLARLLKTLHADIVHGYLFSAEIASRLAGRMAGASAIIGSERNANCPIPMSNRLLYRCTRRGVDVVVANSHAGAESNARMFHLPASQYRVVHNGVDTGRFLPGDGKETRRELGIPLDCPVVGAFANFKKQKNHPMLFRAFRLVRESLPEARLLLVGERPIDDRGRLSSYKMQLNALVDSLEIRDRCVFLGHQEHVERLYSACDVTVLPSFHEGTPNVLLESMACGVPAVATDVCDNRYVVKDGEVGYLVAIGDETRMAHCIRSVLCDSVLRQEMGRKAREWMLAEFSTKRLAEKMQDVYLECLNKGHGH